MSDQCSNDLNTLISVLESPVFRGIVIIQVRRGRGREGGNDGEREKEEGKEGWTGRVGWHDKRKKK